MVISGLNRRRFRLTAIPNYSPVSKHLSRLDRNDKKTTQLIREAKNGSHGALEVLIERSQDRVYSMVRVKMGSALRRHTESGDIVQESLAAAVSGFDQFEPRQDGSWWAWLQRIAQLRLYEAARLAKRQQRQGQDLGSTSNSSDRSYGDPLENVADAEENNRHEIIFSAALASLPAEYRQVIALRDLLELPFSEVAQALGGNEDTAWQLHARATRSLIRVARKLETSFES